MKSLVKTVHKSTMLPRSSRRLFIFAAYDKNNRIDGTLLYYLDELSKFGDIVFTMDNDIPKEELNKLSDIPNIIHSEATRHGEYDFGSYKRGYQWALKNKILDKYDWVYLVNDSAYGPLWDLTESLNKMENSGADFVGMVSNRHSYASMHIQSWFLGLSRNVAMQTYFNEFMQSICHQEYKKLIVCKYEIYLSQMLIQHGHKPYACFENGGLYMYNDAFAVLEHGVPFVKKTVAKRAKTLGFVYQFASTEQINRVFGDDIVNKILSEQDKLDKYDYKKSFRLTLFGIPILTILKQSAVTFVAYKCYVFDKIPVLKVFMHKSLR